MYGVIRIVFPILLIGWAHQQYTIYDDVAPRYVPLVYRISEDGESRVPQCRCSFAEFRVGGREGFRVTLDHVSGFGDMLTFVLQVPEPVRMRSFEVTSPWSRFEHIGPPSLPGLISTTQRIRMRLVGLTSPDFNAGNGFQTRMELSLPSEAPDVVHVVEMGVVLVERTGSQPYATMELEPSRAQNWSLTETEVRGMSGGPCGAVALGLSARLLAPGTLIVRLDAGQSVELRSFQVLGAQKNPDGFRSLVSVFEPDVQLSLPAHLNGLYDLYYRLRSDGGGGSERFGNGDELEFGFVIGGCPYTKVTPVENHQTLQFRARPAR